MQKLALISACIGIVLLGINIIGFFIPLKNPGIYNEPGTIFENDTTLTYEQTITLLESVPNQDTKEYVRDVNTIFNQSIAHYWDDEGIYEYHLTIPLHENYILFFLRYALPSIYKRYEYCGYKKALERGIGQCSQHAIAITDFLNKKGIETHVVGLEGHVVATAKVGKENNEWWILDPDFGVVIPHALATIERSPKTVSDYYADIRYKGDQLYPETFENIYGPDGNVFYPIGSEGYIDCNWKKIIIERISYVLIWVIPILLFIPYGYSKFKRKIDYESLP